MVMAKYTIKKIESPEGASVRYLHHLLFEDGKEIYHSDPVKIDMGYKSIADCQRWLTEFRGAGVSITPEVDDSTLLTSEELALLEGCQSSEDWSVACQKIKSNHDGNYPSDWWAKVNGSGLGDRIMSRWGKTFGMTVTPI